MKDEGGKMKEEGRRRRGQMRESGSSVMPIHLTEAGFDC
jgi:hypothetical protein